MSSTPSLGDHVVHPSHGPGQVVAIEEREFGGEQVTYVTIDVDDMRVMVPKSELEDLGIREPVDADTVDEIMQMLAGDPMKDPGHRGRRNRNDKRIRSGEPAELAKVVRSLKALEADSEKGLKHRDLSDLRAAMDRLVAEMAIALDMDEDEVRTRVMEVVADAGEAAAVDPDKMTAA